jgi:hypothetical protein
MMRSRHLLDKGRVMYSIWSPAKGTMIRTQPGIGCESETVNQSSWIEPDSRVDSHGFRLSRCLLPHPEAWHSMKRMSSYKLWACCINHIPLGHAMSPVGRYAFCLTTSFARLSLELLTKGLASEASDCLIKLVHSVSPSAISISFVLMKTVLTNEGS